jgi:hypothetical protein
MYLLFFLGGTFLGQSLLAMIRSMFGGGAKKAA